MTPLKQRKSLLPLFFFLLIALCVLFYRWNVTETAPVPNDWGSPHPVTIRIVRGEGVFEPSKIIVGVNKNISLTFQNEDSVDHVIGTELHGAPFLVPANGEVTVSGVAFPEQGEYHYYCVSLCDVPNDVATGSPVTNAKFTLTGVIVAVGADD